MIRQLVAYDHDKVMELVGNKPAENLFIIGDIEAFGYDSDFQRLFGQFEGDQLIAILLDYDHNYILYSESAYDRAGFAEIINADEQLTGFSGLREVILPMERLIKKTPKRKSNTYYAKCEKLAVQSEQQLMMIKTCEELLAEGKIICLFYDNPEAGKIYHRLGFEDIGLWNMNKY